jgi:hypothetical protein
MLSLPSTSTQKDDGSKRGQYYLGLIERRRGSIGLNSKDGDESRLGISALEVGTDLLRGGLDCGNKIVVREGVFGDKFVGRDGMVFVVLVYVQATEGHGERTSTQGPWVTGTRLWRHNKLKFCTTRSCGYGYETIKTWSFSLLSQSALRTKRPGFWTFFNIDSLASPPG